jgi:hypothetical protein
MSNTNDLPAIVESKPLVCSCDCRSCCNGILRAALFAPVVLFLGALAAVAMFPDLADYGYPLFGKPSHTGFTGERPCSMEIGNCSFPTNPTSLNSSERDGCCPISRAFQFSFESKDDSEPTAEDASGDFVTKSAISEEIHADTTLPLTLVESEVSSK